VVAAASHTRDPFCVSCREWDEIVGGGERDTGKIGREGESEASVAVRERGREGERERGRERERG